LDVFGSWTAPGEPEPDPPSSITLQLDGGTAVDAKLTRVSPVGARTWFGSFESPPGSFNVADGGHVIKLVATDDVGTRTELVPFTVGVPPVSAALTSTCTIKSATLFTTADTIILTFTQPSSVAITSFPAITPPPVMVSGLTLTVTITMVDAGVGSFNAADGSITIPGVNLEVNASIKGGPFGLINISGVATVQTTLTTGSSRSPAFSDAGAPLAPNGAVTLVGDGVYSTPIFGMSDFGIVLAGILDPHP
jgi:hypothetical protein